MIYEPNDKFKLPSIEIWRRQWKSTPVLLPGKSRGWRSLLGCSPWGRWGSDTTERLHFHFSFSCLEKEMATHSSVLAWRIPGTGGPGGLPSLGSHRVRYDWSDLAAAAAAWLIWRNWLNWRYIQSLIGRIIKAFSPKLKWNYISEGYLETYWQAKKF